MKLGPLERKQVYEACEKGVPISDIQREFCINSRTVRKWHQRGLENPDGNFVDLPRSGRPRKASARQVKTIRQKAQRGHSARQIAATTPAGQHLSANTVCRRLHEGDLTYAGVLRDSLPAGRVTEPKDPRLDWAKEHRGLDAGTIISFDASVFTCGKDAAHGRDKAWQKKGKRRVHARKRAELLVHVYGGVAKGRRLKLIRTRPPRKPVNQDGSQGSGFNSTDFIKVLRNVKRQLQSWPGGHRRYTILMDKARQHTSGDSTTVMSQLGLNYVFGPTKGWDINVIENVWGMMKERLKGPKRGAPITTTSGFEHRLQQVWEGLTQHSIDKLVASIPSRIEKCIENKGAWPTK